MNELNLDNLKGPEYIIEIQYWEKDNEEESGWHWAIGRYIDYTCECDKASVFAHGTEEKDFSTALRMAIKALDENYGEDAIFKLEIGQFHQMEYE